MRARMRVLLGRGTALAAVAGMATVSSCAINLVDPLPPPAGDPSPFPEFCPQLDALAVVIGSARWDANSVLLDLEVQDLPAQLTKPMLESATAVPPIQVSIGADEQVRVSSGQNWPTRVEVSLTYVCGTHEHQAAYNMRVELDTSSPAAAGAVPARIL